jgi:hypothetical protein
MLRRQDAVERPRMDPVLRIGVSKNCVSFCHQFARRHDGLERALVQERAMLLQVARRKDQSGR